MPSANARYALAVPAVLVAVDAWNFARQRRITPERFAAALDLLQAYADDQGGGGGNCNLKGCTANSVDSDCKQIACDAAAAGCKKGSYGSGTCKDLKELHDAACFAAKKGCGDTLPTLNPRCKHWWDYACRIYTHRAGRQVVI